MKGGHWREKKGKTRNVDGDWQKTKGGIKKSKIHPTTTARVLSLAYLFLGLWGAIKPFVSR